jgi:hypothetical protein
LGNGDIIQAVLYVFILGLASSVAS